MDENDPGTQGELATSLKVLESLQGLCSARAVQVAVRLGIADLVANGPKGLAELARRPRTLTKMRCIASCVV
jgi:hypothetical protein